MTDKDNKLQKKVCLQCVLLQRLARQIKSLLVKLLQKQKDNK